ncbi:MAG: hypothetical protein OXI33_11650 [Chloroflexota bacterium]|nr:hypothetical protein [Chloroflexota bacterium]
MIDEAAAFGVEPLVGLSVVGQKIPVVRVAKLPIEPRQQYEALLQAEGSFGRHA